MSVLPIFVLASVLVAFANADGLYVVLTTECNVTAGSGVAGNAKILKSPGHYQCLGASRWLARCFIICSFLRARSLAAHQITT